MDKGLLIREFADAVGVSDDAIMNWEKRGKRPRNKYLPFIWDFIKT